MIGNLAFLINTIDKWVLYSNWPSLFPCQPEGSFWHFKEGYSRILWSKFWFQPSKLLIMFDGCKIFYLKITCWRRGSWFLCFSQGLQCVIFLCWGFMAQSSHWGHVKHRQFTWTTLLLGRLSPPSVNQNCAHSFIRNWQLLSLNQWKGENELRKYFIISMKECCRPSGDRICNLITSRTHILLSHWGQLVMYKLSLIDCLLCLLLIVCLLSLFTLPLDVVAIFCEGYCSDLFGFQGPVVQSIVS